MSAGKPCNPALRRLAAFALLTLSSAVGLAQAADAPPTSVDIRNFMFTPVSLSVPVGTTVRWVNRDDEAHTVVSEAGLFRSGALDTGQGFSYTFVKPGRYRVWCSIHPQMSGVIVVQ